MKPKTKIIFLDIDGVILPVGALDDRGIREVLENPEGHIDLLAERVSKPAIKHLITLATEQNAKFVLISSWRGLFYPSFIQKLMERIGLFEHFHEDWEAPMRGLPPRPNKGQDIGRWLNKHRIAQRDCIVIDDDDLALREYHGFHVLRQVKPISKVGFSRDELARARRLMETKDEQR